MRTTGVLAILFFLSISGLGQDKNQDTLKIDPYRVLMKWTFEDVIDQFGEGVNIIDSMKGQAYIAGFRYQDEWFDRPCELEFYFTDVNVSGFQLRFPHPNHAILEEEDEKRTANLASKQAEEGRESDSLLINRIKQQQPVFDSVAYQKEYWYRKSLLEKDSLRSDSIIREMSLILGTPLREGPTSHTIKDSRYQATWIRRGFSCSLKDYRQFAEVNFGISPAPGSAINEFGLDPETKLIERILLKIKNESLEISLLGVPMQQGSIIFDRLFVLGISGSGAMYLDEVPEESEGGINPRIRMVDLTGDNIDDLWLISDTRDGNGFTNNFIYTLELLEPLLIFDPIGELELGLDGEFQDDYQAMVILDGATRTYLPLDRNKELYKNLYDENGKLIRPVNLRAGPIHWLEAEPYKSSEGSQFIGYFAILGVTNNDIVGYVRVIWDYDAGGWEFTSLEIWKD